MIMVSFSSQGGHRGEGIIKDDIESYQNVLGAGIEDERNGGRMHGGGVPRRETDKDALMSMTVPFGGFLAILHWGSRT